MRARTDAGLAGDRSPLAPAAIEITRNKMANEESAESKFLRTGTVTIHLPKIASRLRPLIGLLNGSGKFAADSSDQLIGPGHATGLFLRIDLFAIDENIECTRPAGTPRAR